jgi:hypothetical protein
VAGVLKGGRMMAGRRLRTGSVAGPLLGLVALAGSVLAPATAATARATGTATVSHSKSPVGWYDEVSSNGGTGQIHLEANYQFETNYGDTGGWVETKTSIALVVYTSTGGDTNCVYLGKLNRKGINSASQQGPTSCSGKGDTWFAVRTKGPTSTPSDGGWSKAASEAGRRTVSASGQYTIPLGGGDTEGLHLAVDGVAVANDGQPVTENGYWVQEGKAVGFELERSGYVCVWVGLLTRTGIGTAAKPGGEYCHDEPAPYHWYATH